jgi:hypothetical protein
VLASTLVDYLHASLVVYLQLLQGEPTPQLQAIDVKLGLLIHLITAAFHDQVNAKLTKDVADWEVAAFLALVDVMGQTEGVIEAAVERETRQTETAILVFLKYFRDTVFAPQRAYDPDPGKGRRHPNVVYTSTGTGNPLQLCDLMLHRITASLRSIEPLGEHVVSIAIKGLQENMNLLVGAIENFDALLGKAARESDQHPWKYLRSPAALVREQLENRYPFTCHDSFHRETSALMSLVAQIALASEDILQRLIEDLDQRFESFTSAPTPEMMYFLLRDLIGIFQNPDARVRLFDWLFPAKLETFQNAISAVLGIPPVLNVLLKFWYFWVKKPKEKTREYARKEDDEDGTLSRRYEAPVRIKAPARAQSPMKKTEHSANGTILFKITATVLTAVFQHIPTVRPELEADLVAMRVKPLQYSLSVFAEVMRADFVMFGAFELYGDSVLADVLQAFIGLLGSFTMPECFEHVKLGRAILDAVKSIAAMHSLLVLQKSPPFFDRLLILVVCGYRRAEEAIVELAVESAKFLSEFLLDRKDEQIVAEAIARNEETLGKVVDAAWDYLCNSPSFKYDNHVALQHFFTIGPGMAPVIGERLRQQIPEDAAAEFQSRFQDILRIIEEGALVTQNSRAFCNALNDFRIFAQGRRLCLLDEI